MNPKFIDCPAFLAELYDNNLRKKVPTLALDVAEPSPEETAALLADCTHVMIDHTQITADILNTTDSLKVIVFMGTGAASYIDLDAAASKKITVRTIKGYGDRGVAEHAIALMFAGVRQLGLMDRGIRDGKWQVQDSFEVAGKVFGVIGTGGIGSEAVRLAAGLGMDVVAWNRSGVEDSLPCRSADLDSVIEQSDVLSIHLAQTPETMGLIDRRRLMLMKEDSILVNTARGAVVDEAALVDVLVNGGIRHAALDVFETEPLRPDHPLCALDNVTLAAHAGFMTREASYRLLSMALDAMAEEIPKGS